jgi:hypothetical protein
MAITIALDSFADNETRSNRGESTHIWVTFALHGIHRYPNAPDAVSYLRDPHRHLFKFKVQIEVQHDDREIEFHMFQNWLKGLYSNNVLQLDHKSCEMLARDLLHEILSTYDCAYRAIEVEVSEDGECGAVLKNYPVRA